MELAVFAFCALTTLAAITFFIRWRTAKSALEQRPDGVMVNEIQQELAAERAKLDVLYQQMKQVEQVRDQKLQELDVLRTKLHEAETQTKLTQQENNSLKERMADWEKVKAEHLEAAKASLVKAGAEMSSKLLDDHKRETQNAKEESEKFVKRTTETLLKSTQTLYEATGALGKKYEETNQKSESIWRALLNPSGAGNLGEIALASVLENSGLSRETYTLQATLHTNENQRLRPDAMVYLPNHRAIAIDSKCSMFFAELAQDNLQEGERKNLEHNLKLCMNNHLKDLVKRDYKQAAMDTYRRERPDLFAEPHVVVLMFLPTEEALGTVRRIDPTFLDRAYKESILPVSPTGLMNQLLSYRLDIASYEQDRNAREIVKEVDKLIKNLTTVFAHSIKLGNSLKSAATHYDGFAASLNKNLPPRVKEFGKLGVESARTAKIELLPRFDIHTHNSLIEGESEEIQEVATVKQLEEV